MNTEDNYKQLAETAINILIPVRFKQTYTGTGLTEFGSGYHKNYRIMLETENGRRFFKFFQGSGHKTEPTLSDVLYCLISDHNCLEYCEGIRDFCTEFSYSEKQGKKVHKQIERNSQKLEDLGILEHIEKLNNVFENY